MSDFSKPQTENEYKEFFNNHLSELQDTDKKIIITKYNVIKDDLITLIKKSSIREMLEKKNEEWKECISSCKKLVKPIFDEEIKTTYFMLKVLVNSIINNDDNDKLTLHVESKVAFNGLWERDKNNIFFQKNKNNPSRLIMGFGPSASGKTFWTKNIIKIMCDSDNSFPNSFISIDGGLMRESSYVYQTLNNEIGYIKNLASTLFNSKLVKEQLKGYLILQKYRKYFVPGIYVPDTLSNPLNQFSLFNPEYTDYISITEDKNWIGLYIWQSKTPEDEEMWEKHMKKNHDFLINYNLKGKSTTTSGQEREIEEGKKYSNKAYSFSKQAGYTHLNKAPKKIIIHNTGIDNNNCESSCPRTSLIIEYPQNDEYVLTQKKINDTLCNPINSCPYLLLHGKEYNISNNYYKGLTLPESTEHSTYDQPRRHVNLHIKRKKNAPKYEPHRVFIHGLPIKPSGGSINRDHMARMTPKQKSVGVKERRKSVSKRRRRKSVSKRRRRKSVSKRRRRKSVSKRRRRKSVSKRRRRKFKKDLIDWQMK
jgi:hypothetical protein